ncbi:M81 family metallopeptidase, partial [Bacillus sp. JJ1521]|uniref:M81 family metallopeptidase n=1 Tax=Bacillus sp. JJ1521 TaxID=3122957 RepID=UPI002FFFB871
MKIVIAEFHQESNSFNPVPCTLDYFERGRIYEGEDIRENLSDKPCAIAGILDAIDEANVQAIPAYSMFTMSGGPVDHAVVDHFINKVINYIQNNNPIDGVFLSLHGATQTTEYEDCSGIIIEELRKIIGEKAVIAVSSDLHANITPKIVQNSSIVCAYHTYPHLDHYETGYRTAKLGLSYLLDEVKPKMVRVGIPMIVPASTYSTMSGPFSELMEYAKSLINNGEVLDFSIYQMQPWLDVIDGESSIIVIDNDEKNALKHAQELAQRLFDMRGAFQPNLHTIEEVITIAEQNTEEIPVILVDSADSTNAGATGDSVEVVRKIIESNSNVKTAIAVVDANAANLSHKLGVGNNATFTIGGTRFPDVNRPLQVEAYIKSLHDGIFAQEGPAGKGMVNNIGPSAVLKVGNIDILVCHHIFGNGDPQLFRAFGLEPKSYQLVVVKACTSFRAAYSLFTNKIYETDTPGA